MSIAAVVTFAIAILIGTLAARSRFPSRPCWWFLRDRPPQVDVWQNLYKSAQMPVVLSALHAISHAFLLRRTDIERLRPDDKLLAIYRAAYPSDQTPDGLEFESLSKELIEQFHVPESVLQQHSDPSVQDVVDWCLRYSGA